MKRKEKGKRLQSFWRGEKMLSSWSEDAPCWFGGCSFIVGESHPSRVLKSLLDLVFDSSLDVDFNCKRNSLGEKLSRGSWNYVGSDWVRFGLLIIRISNFCTFPALLSTSAVKVIWAVSASDLGKSLAQSAPIAFWDSVQFLSLSLRVIWPVPASDLAKSLRPNHFSSFFFTFSPTFQFLPFL